MSTHRSRRGAAASHIPDSSRRPLERGVDELLAGKFQPLLEREGQDRDAGFNYAVEVFREWRGRCLYLCVRYRTPRGRPTEDFTVRTTRLKFIGPDRLDVAYFRHSNRWQPVYSNLTVDECLDALENEVIFWPLT